MGVSWMVPKPLGEKVIPGQLGWKARVPSPLEPHIHTGIINIVYPTLCLRDFPSKSY